MWIHETPSVEDSGPLLELFAKTHAREMSPELYRWKFLENPHGQAVLWVARESSRGPLIGAVAIMPRKCVLRGGEFVGGQFLDAMVDPAFHRRGIFSSLLQFVLREFESRGLDFCFALPAPGSMSIGAFEKLDSFEEFHTWRRHRRFWTGETFAKRLLRSATLTRLAEPALRGWFTLRDRLRVEGLEIREDRYAWESQNSFVMDDAWMRWRTAAPGRTFRTIAWEGGGAILRLNVNTAMLYHLQLGAHAAPAMRAMLDYCKSLPLDALYFDAFVDGDCARLLRRAGFVDHAETGCRLFVATRKDQVRSGFRQGDFSTFRADLDVP